MLNTGSILGDVVLSDGNDRYLGARGSVDGIVSGGGGSDTLVGGTEDNVLLGDDGADLLFGRGGDDTLGGGAGRDLLVGGSGDDDLDGGSGVDTLFGGSGSDTLNGGTGLDALVGGADDDTFVYEQGGGSDRILDFQVDDDLLDLTDFDFADAEEVLDLAREVGRSTVIDFGNGDQIVLLGVNLAELSEDAFLV